jgi:hypothetical protein
VALTRGKEQAQIFTDDKEELLRVMSRVDDPMSATSLDESAKQKANKKKLNKSFPHFNQISGASKQNKSIQKGNAGNSTPDQEMSHDR